MDAIEVALQSLTHPAFVFVSLAHLAVALLSAALGMVVALLGWRPRSAPQT